MSTRMSRIYISKKKNDEMIIEAIYVRYLARLLWKVVMKCSVARNATSRRTRSTAVRYRITGSFGIGWRAHRAPVSRPGRREESGEKENEISRGIGEIGAARGRCMRVLSLHTVYCNIYVRHCNKNANSFVIRCFSSPAQLPLQANELLIRPGSISPSDEIES